jgi:hypothetical protein
MVKDSLRIGCWEEYLDLRGRKHQRTGEKCTRRRFIIYTPCQNYWNYKKNFDDMACHISYIGKKGSAYKILVRILPKLTCVSG